MDVSTELSTQPDEHETVPTQGHKMDSESQAEPTVNTSPPSTVDSPSQGPNFDMNALPYLVER